MAADLILCFDIGTTSVKAVMIDTKGQRLAEFSAPYPTHHPAPGWVVQDPEDWLRLVMAALRQFAEGGAPALAICLTSQVNTHVFVDAALVPRLQRVWVDVGCAASDHLPLWAELDL